MHSLCQGLWYHCDKCNIAVFVLISDSLLSKNLGLYSGCTQVDGANVPWFHSKKKMWNETSEGRKWNLVSVKIMDCWQKVWCKRHIKWDMLWENQSFLISTRFPGGRCVAIYILPRKKKVILMPNFLVEEESVFIASQDHVAYQDHLNAFAKIWDVPSSSKDIVHTKIHILVCCYRDINYKFYIPKTWCWINLRFLALHVG